MDKTFLLGLDSAVAFLPKIMQIFSPKDTYLNENPIWQSPRAMIRRKGLRKDFKRYIDLVLTMYNELGFYKKGFRDFPFNHMLGKTDLQTHS